MKLLMIFCVFEQSKRRPKVLLNEIMIMKICRQNLFSSPSAKTATRVYYRMDMIVRARVQAVNKDIKYSKN